MMRSREQVEEQDSTKSDILQEKQNLNTDRLQMWSCVPTPKTVAGIV